jgi:phosphoenolpyruvate carboxylase
MTKTPRSQPKRRPDNSEQAVVDDIRLLGRILGDVIREQEGEAAYALIEQVRQLSVAFRRDADHEADKALKKLLKSLSNDQTVSVVRAFTYFSHLANLAEDRHHIRRRAVHERAGSLREGSIELSHATPAQTRDSVPTPSARCWPTATCRRCSPPTPPKCSAKAFWMPSASIAHLLTAERDEIKMRRLTVL